MAGPGHLDDRMAKIIVDEIRFKASILAMAVDDANAYLRDPGVDSFPRKRIAVNKTG